MAFLAAVKGPRNLDRMRDGVADKMDTVSLCKCRLFFSLIVKSLGLSAPKEVRVLVLIRQSKIRSVGEEASAKAVFQFLVRRGK